MKSSIKQTASTRGQNTHLAEIRLRVTRNFCIFYTALALIALAASLFANDMSRVILNGAGFVPYLAPLIVILRSDKYRLAAGLLVIIAFTSTTANAVISNLDMSLTTVVWYYNFLVFSHLILGLRWSIGVAVVSLLSVSTFAVLSAAGMNEINPAYNPANAVIGSPIALLVSFFALLYLLTVYHRIRNDLLARILKSNREKNQLLGVISHDVRNSLGTISSIAELFEEELDTCSDQKFVDEARDYLNLIGTASTAGYKLVGSIVEHARVSSEEQLFVEHENVRQFLMPIVERYRLLAREKGVDLTVSPIPESLQFAVSKDKFSRAIENLLSNAVKFCNEGDTITVEAALDNNRVIITVRDTGVGIPANMQDSIFDTFTKAGRPGTGEEKSFGLGLSITKSLVEMHGGAIRFESREGTGTTFFVTMPTVPRA